MTHDLLRAAGPEKFGPAHRSRARDVQHRAAPALSLVPRRGGARRGAPVGRLRRV